MSPVCRIRRRSVRPFFYRTLLKLGREKDIKAEKAAAIAAALLV